MKSDGSSNAPSAAATLEHPLNKAGGGGAVVGGSYVPPHMRNSGGGASAGGGGGRDTRGPASMGPSLERVRLGGGGGGGGRHRAAPDINSRSEERRVGKECC